MDANVAAVIASFLSAIPAMYAAYRSGQNAKQLKTSGDKTLGQHIEILQRRMTRIAEDKVVADAKLTSAALEAIARLTAAKDLTVEDRRKLEAEKIEIVAELAAAKLKAPDIEG